MSAAGPTALAWPRGLAPLTTLRDDRAFATACDARRWLPIARVASDMSEAPTGASSPVVVLAGAHGAVRGERLIEFRIAPPSRAERVRQWRTALGSNADDLAPHWLETATIYPGMLAAVARAATARANAEHRALSPADIVERTALVEALQSSDQEEGVSAFREKRPPQWRGR